MDEVEKCPSCGETMEKGWLAANAHILWCDESNPPGVWMKKGETLTKGWLKFNPGTIAGYRCKTCRIIRYLKSD